MVLERPKVMHNPRTGKFVMWMHIDSGDYQLARLGVAISDNPHGPFRYQGSFRPHGQQSRDFTVFAVSLLPVLWFVSSVCPWCQQVMIQQHGMYVSTVKPCMHRAHNDLEI